MTATSGTAAEAPADPTVPALTDLPLGDRVAADLATLGELAQARPELADLVATTVSQLFLVIAMNAPITVDDVTATAAAIGATEYTDTSSTDEYFPTRHLDLPAGVVRLSVLQLDTTTPFGWFAK